MKKIYIVGLFALVLSVVMASMAYADVCQIFNQQDMGRKLYSVNGNSAVFSCCIQNPDNPDPACTCQTQIQGYNCSSVITLVRNALYANGTDCINTASIIDFSGCGLATKGCGHRIGVEGDYTDCKRKDAGTAMVVESVVSQPQKFYDYDTNTSEATVNDFYELGTVVVQEDSGSTIVIDGRTYYAKYVTPTDPNANIVNQFTSRTYTASTGGGSGLVVLSTEPTGLDKEAFAGMSWKVIVGILAIVAIGYYVVLELKPELKKKK